MNWAFKYIAALMLVLGFAHGAFAQQDDANLLKGVIDFHCHTAPDIMARSITDFDLVRIARRAGMRAIVLKSHVVMTADRAELAMQELGGIEVFGGVVLNRSVGGINSDVVQKMTQMEGHRGKIVWLPTADSEAQAKMDNIERPVVPVVKDGQPVPELAPIFDIIAKNDLVLETGHSSAAEALIIIDAAQKAGVKKIVITHAMADPVGATEDQMRQMADKGVLMEMVWLNTISVPGSKRRFITVPEYAKVIKDIGAEHFIIASDLGQQINPVHPAGMISFIRALKAEGITDQQIDLLARKNPARMLGLES